MKVELCKFDEVVLLHCPDGIFVETFGLLKAAGATPKQSWRFRKHFKSHPPGFYVSGELSRAIKGVDSRLTKQTNVMLCDFVVVKRHLLDLSKSRKAHQKDLAHRANVLLGGAMSAYSRGEQDMVEVEVEALAAASHDEDEARAAIEEIVEQEAAEIEAPLPASVEREVVRIEHKPVEFEGGRIILSSLLRALPVTRQTAALFAYRINAGQFLEVDSLTRIKGQGLEGLPEYTLTRGETALLRSVFLKEYPAAAAFINRTINNWPQREDERRPSFMPRRTNPKTIDFSDDAIGRRLAQGHKYELELTQIITSRGALIVPLYALKGTQGNGGDIPYLFNGPCAALAPDLIVFDVAPIFVDVKARRRQVYDERVGEYCHSLNYEALSNYQEINKATGAPVLVCIKDLKLNKWYQINVERALKFGMWQANYPGSKEHKRGGVLLVPVRHMSPCEWCEPPKQYDILTEDQIPF